MGVQQPVIARLERDGTDPRFSTVVRALQAAGQVVSVEALRVPAVDEAQIAAQLRLSPAERLRTFERGYGNVRDLTLAAKRVER
jgi:predicted transcriptional regulator